MGRFTRNDARSVIFNFVSADVASTAETLYGSDDDLKNLDGHKFYKILMDAKNSTLSDLETDVTMPIDTNFGAYRLYSFCNIRRNKVKNYRSCVVSSKSSHINSLGMYTVFSLSRLVAGND